jgi:hypothetical protein
MLYTEKLLIPLKKLDKTLNQTEAHSFAEVLRSLAFFARYR